ncbi:MAG TPA: DUF6531 domain-containing protein, partial [Vineibacter sp.]|nr:DUF6531 domain-containing protein [Vineibacter sp.]
MDTALPAVNNAAALARRRAASAHGNGPKAARLGDPIEHSRALAGFLIGAVVGLAVGAAIVAATVATGGAALAVVAAVGTAAASTGGGALLGEAIGGATTYHAGDIAPICSHNVLVNRKPAARAIVDVGACSNDGPPPKPIAQGSKTVMINHKPAARVGDRLVCDGKISDGSPNVRIGGQTTTYLEITPEVPEWLHTGAEILMWTGTAVALVAGAAAAAVGGGLCGLLTFGGRTILGLAGSLIGSELAAPIGRAIDGKRGEIIARAIGGFLGGGLGARSSRGHPVDVATGELFTEQTDFAINGPLPLVWSRLWISSSPIDGALGRCWHHSYDMALLHCPEHGGWAARLGDGRLAVFVDPAPGRPAPNTVERLFLETDGQNYGLLGYNGLHYAFGPPDETTGLRHLIRISDPNGNAIELERDLRGLLHTIRDSAGRTLHVTNDDFGRITAIDAPHPDREGETLRLVTYSYDAAGDLIEACDARGSAFHYQYANHLLIQEGRRGGLVFHFVWDDPALGRAARCIDTWGEGPGERRDLFRARLAYDLEARETVVVNGRGAVTRYRWNALGLVDEEIDAIGGITKRQWDDGGRLLRVTTPDDHTTSYAYDALGRTVAEVGRDGTLRFDYALHGSSGVGHGNSCRIVEPDGAVHDFIYDLRGNLAIYRDPTGHEQRYARDTRGLVLATLDALGTRRRFTWSAAGELLAEGIEGDARIRYEYDRLGRMVAASRTGETVTRMSRDANGNVVEVCRPDGVTKFDYDAEDQLVGSRDPLGRQRSWRYDGLPIPVERIEADGSVLRYGYDSELNLVDLTNAKGEQYVLEYDPVDRLSSETGFDGRRLEYRYDSGGGLDALHDEGQSTIFTRDARGRLSEKRFADGTVHRFAWDAVGRLVAADSPARRVAFAYDAAGRLTMEQQDDQVLRHRYDARGRRESSVLPDGRVVRLAYGNDDMVSSLALDGDVLTWFRRDAAGREIERRAGALHQTQEFDPQGRLIRQRGFRWRAAGDLRPVLARSYTWNPADELTAVDDAHRGLKHYHTDVRGRLMA